MVVELENFAESFDCPKDCDGLNRGLVAEAFARAI